MSFLQAEQLDAVDFGEPGKMLEGNGALRIVAIIGVALPGDADPEWWTVDGGQWTVEWGSLLLHCRPLSTIHRPLQSLPPPHHQFRIRIQVRNRPGNRANGGVKN